jgi:hypothetical protein
MTLRYAQFSPDRLGEAVGALEDFRNASARKSAQGGKIDSRRSQVLEKPG